MAERTVGDLYKAKDVSPDDIDVAVRVYLDGGEQAGPIPLGKGYTVDVAKALAAHEPSAKRLAAATDPVVRHGTVRTAILLAVPTAA